MIYIFEEQKVHYNEKRTHIEIGGLNQFDNSGESAGSVFISVYLLLSCDEEIFTERMKFFTISKSLEMQCFLSSTF